VALSGGWSPTARWRSPRIPARDLEQHHSSLEICEGIQQWGLFACDTCKTDRSSVVAFKVVVDPVDLEQTRIGFVGCFRPARDVAVLVND
jgi:hypothetical protein